MRTGLTKKQKTTAIYFDEYSNIIEVQTHNTDLKRRLREFAEKYPQCCSQTAPYSKERRQAASEWAKKNSIAAL